MKKILIVLRNEIVTIITRPPSGWVPWGCPWWQA